MGTTEPDVALFTPRQSPIYDYGKHLFREDEIGQLLPETLGEERLTLQEQRLQIGSQELVLVEPADVDAVMDMYINRGEAACLNDTSVACLQPACCQG